MRQRNAGVLSMSAAVMATLTIAAPTLPNVLHAEAPNAVRGGWVADVDGRTQVYMLIVRGDTVTGTQCVDCSNPRNLGFILEGHLDPEGVHFVIRHEAVPGKITFDDVRGILRDQELVLRLQRRNAPAHPTTLTLHRPPPMAPVPAVTNDEAEARPVGRPRPAYELPGPPERVTADKVLGLWLWATGPGKQYFIIQRVGSQLLGMVCGPCENPNTMAPLDGFVIDGTDLRFNIVHEDTGAAVEHGPFNNVAHATLSHNEMHLKVIPSFQPPDSRPFEMTLLGPVTFAGQGR